MPGPRILLAGGGTGGHLYPALNLRTALERLDPSTECLFLGSERGIEAHVLPTAGVEYRLLPLQPIHRARPWRNWRLLWTAPSVASGVASAFRGFSPTLAVGTGGYVSGPALAWALWKKVPTALQEQNARPGIVTRLLAPRVDQVHLGYPEAARHLRPGRHTRVLAFGNPVPPPEASPGEAPGHAWPEGRVLLVVGGSQGARGINRALLGDLEREAGHGTAVASESGPRARRGPGGASSAASPPAPDGSRAWPDDLWLVWVAGREHVDEVSRRAERLPWAARIRVVPYIEDLGRQLDRVTLAISRAGAMLVAELCAAGCPSVLVPLPTAAAGHQLANARALEEAGAAVVREESDLGPGDLWTACRELLDAPARLSDMARAARDRGEPDAALHIAQELLRLARRVGS